MRGEGVFHPLVRTIMLNEVSDALGRLLQHRGAKPVMACLPLPFEYSAPTLPKPYNRRHALHGTTYNRRQSASLPEAFFVDGDSI